jgi:uncharacterized protein (TIGR03435 family)
MVHALTVTLLTPCVGLAWQTPIAFEVATIKPSTANSLPIGIRRNQSQFTTSNTSIAFLIRWVYDLDERRLVGTTNNLESIRYDIVGKVPAGELAPGQLQLMMQSLLADRFKLRVHKEMRELSAYALVVDKDGPKLHFVDLEDGIGQNPFKMTDRGRLVGTKVTADMLAKVLSGRIGRPIEDATEIKQPFDFVLEWAPDMALSESEAQSASADATKRASIFTAIREQLGLRLISRKSVVEVVKIDSVNETPTEN